jgi:hypothetical protein
VAQRFRIAGGDVDHPVAVLHQHLPRATLLRPLTARSSVDLPEPDKPISTEISPSLTVRLAPAAPSTAPVLARMSAREAPAIDHAPAPGGFVAEDDVDVLEFDGDAHFFAPAVTASAAVENDGQHDDGETRLDAERDVTVGERPLTGLPRLGAPMSVANTTIDSDSMMHWVRPAMIDGSAGRQFDLPEKLPLRRAEAFAGLEHRLGDRGDAEIGHADRRRHGEDDGDDQAWRSAQAEEDEDGIR